MTPSARLEAWKRAALKNAPGGATPAINTLIRRKLRDEAGKDAARAP